MTAATMITIALSALLVIVGMMVFVAGGSPNRRLQERVLATRDIKTSQSSGPNDLLMGMPVKSGILLRLAAALGYQADLPTKFAASLRIVIPIAGIVGVLAFALGKTIVAPHLAALAGIGIGVLAARFLFKRKSKAYTALLFRQIPDTMSLILRAVRAGLPVTEAVRSVGRESMSPTQEEFARAAGETALGLPLDVALRRLAERTKIQEYAFFAVVIGLHAQTGGNLSETMENLAEMVRRRVNMAGKARAMSAEGRLSAVLMAALPFVVAIGTFIATPEYMREFVSNPKGRMLIGIFIILLSTGLFITHLLIQRSTED